jgi:hypothetical protein
MVHNWLVKIVLVLVVLGSLLGSVGCAAPIAAAVVVGYHITITVGDLVLGMVMVGGAAAEAKSIADLRNQPEWAKAWSETQGMSEADLASASMSKTVVVDAAHAEQRHGLGIVDLTEDCLRKFGAVKHLLNPETGRVADICADTVEAKFYVKIAEKTGDLVTTFMKEKMKRLDQVLSYLNNRGYILP